MDDIRRPGAPAPTPRPLTPPVSQMPPVPLPPQQQYRPQVQPQPQQPQQYQPPQAPQSPIAPLDIEPVAPNPKPRRKKTWLWVLLGLILLLAGLAAGGWFWYQSQLSPVNSNATDRVRVTIEPGTGPSQIAQQLKDESLIKSTEVFALYTRISGTQNRLQAGSYHLSQSETLPEIVGHLTSGNVDSFDITFLPGATLADNRKVLIAAGYDETEVDVALSSTYSSPLFQDKPAAADLEGYIYGETYRVASGSTAEDVLALTFAEYWKVIEANNLIAGFQTQGLNLYQGITLASIIQRESIGGDEPQIAQVFLTRLDMDMALGSDVTYQYIADKTGVARSVDLDSPYNTRRYPGLPPGPISAPGVASLRAVANPAPGDFVFFLSGDDDVTYFARTVDEHEANIRNHCTQKCQIL